MSDNKISEYITFPKTFENYKWYKPILVFITGFILYLIFVYALNFIFQSLGFGVGASLPGEKIEILNNSMGQVFTYLGIIMFVPALYLASKIVKDRPFSSYSSSRGGWNYKLYFKALIIPLALIAIVNGAYVFIKGPEGTYHFTLPLLILTIILCPLQCIAEEYLYRGLFMQTFGAWFGIPIALILQAVIFTVSHGYNTVGLIEVFVFGIVLGFLTWKTNGIEVSSAIHTANNFLLALFVMVGLQSVSSTPSLVETAIFAIIDVLLCMLMYYIGNKTDWFGEITEN